MSASSPCCRRFSSLTFLICPARQDWQHVSSAALRKPYCQTCPASRTRSGLRPPLHKPTRPAHAAPEPAAPPQSTAFPWLAAARLPPLLVPLVVLRMLVALAVMADETYACILPLLGVLLLLYCPTYTHALVLSLLGTLVLVLLVLLRPSVFRIILAKNGSVQCECHHRRALSSTRPRWSVCAVRR